jgi:tripartite-type tricarboxylate transporter receptor subunit TctC
MRLGVAFAALCGSLFGLLPCATAQQSAPVRVVVPFFQGDFEDLFARMVVTQVELSARRPLVVENRPGDEAHFGAEVVARAKPDGSTLLFAPVVHYAAAAALYSGLHFNLVSDFTPIALVANAPQVLAAHPSLPVKSVGELIVLAKAQPTQLKWGAHDDNLVSRLQLDMFGNASGLKLETVRHKNVEIAYSELLAGRVALMFDSVVATLAHVKAGRLRALAVTGAQRAAVLPQTPTMAQAGVKGYEADYWYGILAPDSVDRPTVTRLQGDFTKALGVDDLRKRLLAHGIESSNGSAEELVKILRTETAKWPDVRSEAAARSR